MPLLNLPGEPIQRTRGGGAEQESCRSDRDCPPRSSLPKPTSWSRREYGKRSRSNRQFCTTTFGSSQTLLSFFIVEFDQHLGKFFLAKPISKAHIKDDFQPTDRHECRKCCQNSGTSLSSRNSVSSQFCTVAIPMNSTLTPDTWEFDEIRPCSNPIPIFSIRISTQLSRIPVMELMKNR